VSASLDPVTFGVVHAGKFPTASNLGTLLSKLQHLPVRELKRLAGTSRGSLHGHDGVESSWSVATGTSTTLAAGLAGIRSNDGDAAVNAWFCRLEKKPPRSERGRWQTSGFALARKGDPDPWRILAYSDPSGECIEDSALFKGGSSMSVHVWEDVVKQIEQEADSAKIAELAKKLNDAMVSEAKEKVKHRLGISPDES